MINILVFTKNNCGNCMPAKLFLDDVTPTLENVEFKYKNLDEMMPEVRQSTIDKYRLQSMPAIIFYRNGHEMARTSGPFVIDEFADCLEHARNAK